MNTLGLPLAMPLHGAVDRADATWVGLVDVADAQTAGGRVALEAGELFDRARLIVRDGGSIRGYVTLPVSEGSVDAEDLLAAITGLPPVAPHSYPVLSPISVVLCTRDRADLLRESLDSIRALDYDLLEVIVVDNAPSDSATYDLLTSAYPEFRYVREDAPGLSHARNAGLRAASSAIVAFTDDDVVVDTEWLKAIASGFARADDVGCVSGVVPSGELRNAVQAYFDARVSWSKLTTARVFRLSDPPSDLPMFPFSVGEFGTGANFAIRRDEMIALGEFDTALGAGTQTKGGEDLDMFLRVLYYGKSIVVEPSAMVWHRHRSDLDALRAQAVGYGRGFGAWALTVASDPRMLGSALARAPRAVGRLLNKPMSTVDDGGARELGGDVAKVGRLELRSIFGGPLAYFRERRQQMDAGTFTGPPSRRKALDRRMWSALALVAGILGLLAAIPAPTWVSLPLLTAFVLVGPGSVVLAWVSLPPHLAPITVPALGVSAVILLTTAMAFASRWAPTLSLVVLAAITCVVSIVSFRVRSST